LEESDHGQDTDTSIVESVTGGDVVVCGNTSLEDGKKVKQKAVETLMMKVLLEFTSATIA
jgi:hypothetical protein